MSMFWKRSNVAELDPVEVHALFARGDVHLIDVREQQEHQAERIDGAICMPLSRFDPKALGVDPATVVFHCLSGKRSAMAVTLCQRVGIAVSRHMRGGLVAWKAAGLPTRRR
jgi:rhodanese-related sulfurtransferase